MIASVSSSPSNYGSYLTPAEAKPAGQEKAAQQSEPLSDEEKKQVNELKNRDREVRAHEAAHISAGGAHVKGSASYSYQVGPDGKRYAVGGEVSVDTSKVAGDPQKTIEKAMAIRSAALAPASPSGQDQAVAAQASRMLMEARAELAKARQDDGEQPASSIKSIMTNDGYSLPSVSKPENSLSEYA